MKTNLVTIQNGKAVTSSLQVAQKFGKEHKDVLKAIRNFDCSLHFKERNFAQSFYIREIQDRGQRKYPMYYLTRDGFTFLVMGFTGKLAGQFKEEYINAFNQMEQHIQKGLIDEKELIKLITKEIDSSKMKTDKYIKGLNKEHNLRLLPGGLMTPSWNHKSDFKSNINNILAIHNNNLLTAIYDQFRVFAM